LDNDVPFWVKKPERGFFNAPVMDGNSQESVAAQNNDSLDVGMISIKEVSKP